jgi:hypothetical protein
MAHGSKKSREMASCPHCGADIRRDAAACPVCGSDERTGWSEDTYLDGLDLPDPEEYEELREAEFAGGTGGRSRRLPVWVTGVGVVLLALILLWLFAGIF